MSHTITETKIDGIEFENIIASSTKEQKRLVSITKINKTSIYSYVMVYKYRYVRSTGSNIKAEEIKDTKYKGNSLFRAIDVYNNITI